MFDNDACARYILVDPPVSLPILKGVYRERKTDREIERVREKRGTRVWNAEEFRRG